MATHRSHILGLPTLQASGALLIAGLLTGCGAPDGSSGQTITAPTQNAQPAPQGEQQPTGDNGTRTSETSQPNEVERCHTSMLTGSLQEPEAGAGQRYARLVLRNSSDETCTLYGYGGLQLVDEAGRPLPTKMERTPNPGPSLVTLAPGETAGATLHWTVVAHDGEPTDGPCQPTPASAQVIPPDETDPLTVEWNSGPVCGFGAIDGTAYHR